MRRAPGPAAAEPGLQARPRSAERRPPVGGRAWARRSAEGRAKPSAPAQALVFTRPPHVHRDNVSAPLEFMPCDSEGPVRPAGAWSCTVHVMGAPSARALLTKRPPFVRPASHLHRRGSGAGVSRPGHVGDRRGETRAGNQRPGAPGPTAEASTRSRPLPAPPRTLAPLPIPLLLEERRQRAEGLQVLDGRGHHDARHSGGQLPGRRHLASAEPGDDDARSERRRSSGREAGE